ncbi:MAG: arsenate reductase (glutaredoxin) [Gammaproteobacteria bacterium]
MSIKIYHNPRCSKSRQTLQLLEDRGIEPTIVAYLTTPPDANELAAVLEQLGKTVDEIMRTGEDAYKACKTEVAAMNDAEKLQWLSEHPKVIQRPIVINGDRARIGRPPESVLEILS